MWRDDSLLLDILLAAGDAREFVEGLDWVGFSNSKLHQSAVERCMGIIGEAAAQVSKEFQERHPEIPWRKMIGMRHRLIHAYNEVRLDVVWEVVQNDLPSLIETLKPLIPPEDDVS
jgi:uncharacterized protein with HEPN domain